MAQLSFALYEAHNKGVTAEILADTLDLPLTWIVERIEAARLCLLVTEG